MNNTTIRLVKPEEAAELKDMCAEYMHQMYAPRKIDVTPMYPFMDRYFTEADRFPYYIFHNDTLCGFALVNSHCVIESRSPRYSFGEFYVRQEFRLHGVGTAAATQLFDLHRGYWEIRELADNASGTAFWRRLLTQYADGNFTEMELNDERWKGWVQLFSNV